MFDTGSHCGDLSYVLSSITPCSIHSNTVTASCLSLPLAFAHAVLPSWNAHSTLLIT